MMACFMLSLAGIPPWVGFWAKLHVIAAVLDAGRFAGDTAVIFFSVAVIMVLFSVVGAFYYLRVLKYMYFDEAVDRHTLEAPADMRVALSLNGLAVIGVGLAPGGLFALCAQVIG
ncbi:MAG: proton-conducting transporter membrane subunit, partial [Pseudomonadota bacterium]